MAPLLMGDVFANAARAVPDRVAAVLGDQALTFGQIDAAADRTARALAAQGVARGDRVAVWTANTLDLVPLFAAAAKLGAVFAPVNGGLSPAEALDVVASARPTLLLVDEPRRDLAPEVAGPLGIPALGIGGLADVAGGEAPPGAGELARVAASCPAEAVTDPALGEDDPHVVFFTSGSTGRPKGAVLSHRVSVLRCHPGAQLEARGAMLCPYPMFHMAVWTISTQQWHARDAVVYLQGADAGAICEAVERHRVERLNAVPAVWRRVLDHVGTPTGPSALPTLRFADSGTSATPPELLAAVRAAVPQAAIRVFYGSTEAGNVAGLEDVDIERKPGSCGVPSSFTQVRLDGSGGHPGGAGELLVRSPLLFDGYFGDAEATAAALDGGWYRTGDLAEADDEGYLRIVGRAKDVIRTGGETVSPGEVEAALAGFPGVAELAVVGVPHPDWGEVVCAAVVLAPGAALPAVDDLRAHCRDRLASFKQPRLVVAVASIPRTASTGQVQRPLLVEAIAARPA